MVSVYWFVPNLIGYARLVLSLLSFIFYNRPFVFVPAYVISFLLDGLDGTAARALNQCSQYGAILDMLTDRGSVMCLYAILAVLFPALAPLWLIAGFLDVVSHYAHMYKSIMLGEKSHKKLPPGTFWYLRLYYEKRKFMGALCLGNEFFLIAMYLVHFFPSACDCLCVRGVVVILAFLWMGKQFAHVCQMASAMWGLADFDEKERAKAAAASRR